ncbi:MULTISPECIES: DUF3987 domain-containing protein [unclassified Coleofasciculus]|uniref:DUF3987 domain-containing protein n=1 Tax=unclassified Coleofasciculus TaxID=2692782 RepID=UPI00187E70AA|nr:MULTISPECIES: DUF3987 domain-containing protein [unclassified Coleofasciculus]MBE9125607.1 DUF3987 domain-containing protein [Coleofasciculus sp. LEGE 07081]MBE9147321.1 DUF3987 domain-containing protein [Coleofasciculus sp. LEGE 07092]
MWCQELAIDRKTSRNLREFCDRFCVSVGVSGKGGQIMQIKNLERVSKTEPCLHCGKSDWCYRIGSLDCCKRQAQPAQGWHQTSKSDSDGTPYYARVELQQKPIRPAQRRNWLYLSRSGQRLIQVCRIDDGKGGKPKRWQEEWDGAGWQKEISVNRQDIPVYRYQEIQKAIAHEKTIWIVEGEPCADALWDLGIPATTNIGGSGKWRESDTQDIAAAVKVVLCPDRDKPGLKHMQDIAAALPPEKVAWCFPFPESLSWRNLPTSQGVDIADWILDFKLNKAAVLAAVSSELPEFLKTSPSLSTELLKKIQNLVDRNLPDSELQIILRELSEQIGWTTQELKTLYLSKLQESDRQQELGEGLPDLEKLLRQQMESQAFDWGGVLPEPVFRALKTKADSSRIDPMYLIQNLFPAIGGLIGANVGLICKKGATEKDHWIEPPIIWTAVIAPPSTGKSDADRAIFRPIRELQDRQITEYENAKNHLEELEEDWRSYSSEEKQKLRGTEQDPSVRRQEIGSCRKFLLDEGEIEAIKRRIAEQPPAAGITWSADELLGLFRGLDQYKGSNKGNGRQFLLKAWSGPLTGYVDRVNEKESFRFQGQCLNLCGGIQIEPASEFFDADGRSVDADGLQSRILPAVPGLREDFEVWSDVLCDVNGLLADLYSKIQNLPKGLVSLSPQAAQAWQRQWTLYRKGFRQHLNSNPAYAYFQGKMCSNLMRLALVLHCLEFVYSPTENFYQLELSTLTKAIAAADYYLGQFRLMQVQFSKHPEQGMSEFMMKILNFALDQGELTPSQVVNKFRRQKGEDGKPIRSAEVVELFRTIALARPQRVKLEGKKLIALPPPPPEAIALLIEKAMKPSEDEALTNTIARSQSDRICDRIPGKCDRPPEQHPVSETTVTSLATVDSDPGLVQMNDRILEKDDRTLIKMRSCDRTNLDRSGEGLSEKCDRLAVPPPLSTGETGGQETYSTFRIGDRVRVTKAEAPESIRNSEWVVEEFMSCPSLKEGEIELIIIKGKNSDGREIKRSFEAKHLAIASEPDPGNQAELLSVFPLIETKKDLQALVSGYGFQSVSEAFSKLPPEEQQRIQNLDLEKTPIKITELKVGDRVRSINGGGTATVTAANDCLCVTYDTSPSESRMVDESWFESLPEAEDPKFLAFNLYDQIVEGCKLKVGKHPYHGNFTNRVGTVLQKNLLNGVPVAELRLDGGNQLLTCYLEFAKLHSSCLQPGMKIRFKKWYGELSAKISATGRWLVRWENHKKSLSLPPSEPLSPSEFEVIV